MGIKAAVWYRSAGRATIRSGGSAGPRTGPLRLEIKEITMAFGFNADEILQMVERIERNGARFYRRAAEACQADEASKATFLELAEMNPHR